MPRVKKAAVKPLFCVGWRITGWRLTSYPAYNHPVLPPSEDYFFFAFGFGRSVMLPSKISAARPTDSCRVGCA
ncbi:hypothetical protein AHX05_18230 [Salmonella enterica subsp. indica]|uniref:Uncharacterized protein n=3 Tax=Salmonella enterica TaxID=28901 RepID=A0A5Y2QMC7_SALER|nr:hypothetical protein [Salmonella enterica subsp. indica]EBH9039880.1 hypothetical protein [Salmonella enterica subsp. indica serovar 11:b:e,n,x]EBP3213561.1 hypothetical protein [Salmonella enterica subsp. arizonae]ECI8271679.1 hypothetical protein [Salmonella enterica subsp. enterica]EDR2772724.1 hypothetical protein [Salmonella enterica subsp. enterica serovar Oslo]HAE8101229.1 hypothetical protein [Salmonella enterica subsp. indica serovar 45:a:e,n,x]